MRIAFFDSQRMDYTAETPYREPLGGSQSAVCYLAVELAQLGHDVAVLNATRAPGKCRGVHFLNLSQVPADFLDRHDVVVVLNWARGGVQLRQQFGVRAPLVLWVSHASDQPIVSPLAQREALDVWDGFAFVSKWQRDSYIEAFGIPAQKARILRNAVSPAMCNGPLAAAWFERGEPPVLGYTSAPFRGLDVLLMSYRAIRSAIPDVRLRVFSSMAIYQVEDEYSELYSICGRFEGVDYRGAIGQSQLSHELRDVGCLTYPSTFAETSCIAVLEAMATGSFIFTTRLGALPETTNGFAYTVDPDLDRGKLAERFAAMTITGLRELQQDPGAAADRRAAQSRFVRENYSWSRRATEWVDWLQEINGR
jgi:glycosyltransferase involved in cell wall biosynthesis